MARNIVLEFIQHINNHDVEAIADMLSDDHTYTDSHNNSINGKENTKAFWKLYFKWFPDYTIEISDIIQGNTCTAAIGFARGTFLNLQNEHNSNHWHLPAAWKIVAENNKIKLWQIYMDTRVPSEIMEKNKI